MRQNQPSKSTDVSVHLVGSDNTTLDRALRSTVAEKVQSLRGRNPTTTKGENTVAVQKPKRANDKNKPRAEKPAKPKKEKVPIQKAKDFKTYAEYCEYRAGLFQEKVDAWKKKAEDFRTGKLGKNKKIKKFQAMQAKIADLEKELREAGLDPDKLEALPAE